MTWYLWLMIGFLVGSLYGSIAMRRRMAKRTAEELQPMQDAINKAENEQCGCLGGTLREWADNSDATR